MGERAGAAAREHEAQATDRRVGRRARAGRGAGRRRPRSAARHRWRPPRPRGAPCRDRGRAARGRAGAGGAGTPAGTATRRRATRTTASAWRRQKSLQAASPRRPTRRRRGAPGRAASAPSRASGSTTPGKTTDRCVASRAQARPRRRRRPAARVQADDGDHCGLGPPVRRCRWPAVRRRSATWVSTVRAAAGRSRAVAAKAVARHLEHRRVAAGTDARRALLAGQQRQLAQHVARSELAHEPSTCDLEPPATHDVRRTRRVALPDQPRPRADSRCGRAGLEPAPGAVGAGREASGRRRGRSAAAGRAESAPWAAGSSGSSRRGSPSSTSSVSVDECSRRGAGRPRRPHERDDREHPAVAEDGDRRGRGGVAEDHDQHGDPEHAAQLASAGHDGRRGRVATSGDGGEGGARRAAAASRRRRCR